MRLKIPWSGTRKLGPVILVMHRDGYNDAVRRCDCFYASFSEVF